MEKLSKSHHKLFSMDHDAQGSAAVAALYRDDRAELLKDIPESTVKKAWFTLAHLLLSDGAHIADIGCTDGKMAYAMAVLNPEIKVSGIDLDRKAVTQAKKKYQRPNLEFIVDDITQSNLPENSLDAVINSFVCHEIYSNADYSDRFVMQTLENQFKLLKQDGVMFIRDHALPYGEDFILMEFPDKAGTGTAPEELSEAELLVLYSEIARTPAHEGFSGFFLEELPARFPGTRLFRLPYKWAYEFIMRKDHRNTWKGELEKEYAFFSEKNFRYQLKSIGGRLLYSAPYWSDAIIEKHFKNHFKLYDDDGLPLGYPPTSFICVVQNVGKRKSLALEERRYTKEKAGTLRISAMRNEKNGQIIDTVSRNMEIVEFLPYRFDAGGKIKLYLHEGLPRGIVNAVPRKGYNLDGKEWSGHMIEPISISSDIVKDVDSGSFKEVIRFSHNYAGLKPAIGCQLEKGPGFYPNPHHIDERIETRYLCVEKAPLPFWDPKTLSEDIEGFSAKGKIREYDAQGVLNAISVGLIPNARLELQILALFEKLDIKAEKWTETPLQLKEKDNLHITPVSELLARLNEEDDRYKPIKGARGDLRILKSVFVEEGQNQRGGMTGLAARDMEFFVSDDNTVNTAVVLPLTKDINGEVMAGIVTEYLPIPQRFKGNGFTVSAPSFTLPKDVKSIDAARRYIAEQFEVEPHYVTRMGESFFCHNGLTPQRIYPFAVTNVKDHYDGQCHGTTSYTCLKDLWQLIYLDNSESFMKIVGLAYAAAIGIDSDMSPDYQFSTSQAQERSEPVFEHAEVLNAPSASNDVISFEKRTRAPE